MPPVSVDPSLRLARASVFAIFGVNGFLLAMWVVHIPTITERTDVSKATLGGLILLLAGSALIGMQVAGPLADRFGSRRLVALSAIAVSATVIGPALANNTVGLGIALIAFGFGNGALDVSMNSQAVHVERAYGRPIMSAFHALFSCGGLAGALLGAATLAVGLDVRLSLAIAALIGLAVTAIASRHLLPHVHQEHSEQQTKSRISTKVLALGAIAFALLLAEGVANDWSTLQVKEHLGASDAIAAVAFGAFSLMMTLGRFTADRVSRAFGAVAVVRYGALIASSGLAVVMASDWVALTIVGWALFGLGLSGGVPQIFSAAGNLSIGSAGANMSRVFGMGYIGLLAGPALIGWLTKLMPLTTALAVPLVAVLLCSLYRPPNA